MKYAGIDADAFQLSEPRPSRRGRRILAIGRLTAKKGFDQLVRAMARLVVQSPGVECTIVGDRRDGPELAKLVDELGLGEVVNFVGSATPDELKQLLAESDVLAAPCTAAPWGDRDSMPVVIKEAMAMELPVITTRYR